MQFALRQTSAPRPLPVTAKCRSLAGVGATIRALVKRVAPGSAVRSTPALWPVLQSRVPET